MYYKYYYSFIYNWSKLKITDFSENKNDFYFRTEVLIYVSKINIRTPCILYADVHTV
jgi:hypothetical protein